MQIVTRSWIFLETFETWTTDKIAHVRLSSVIVRAYCIKHFHIFDNLFVFYSTNSNQDWHRGFSYGGSKFLPISLPEISAQGSPVVYPHRATLYSDHQ